MQANTMNRPNDRQLWQKEDYMNRWRNNRLRDWARIAFLLVMGYLIFVLVIVQIELPPLYQTRAALCALPFLLAGIIMGAVVMRARH